MLRKELEAMDLFPSDLITSHAVRMALSVKLAFDAVVKTVKGDHEAI